MIQDLFNFDQNYNRIIIGTDEAGRGPAAGGVFAAAVYFPETSEALMKGLSTLNDSKKLSRKKRESIYDLILNNTINSIINVEVEEIEEINILNASLKAMKLACEEVIEKLPSTEKENILTLVDGDNLIRSYTYPQEFVIKGDAKSASIAAASILAKVTRDRYMDELDAKYPQYDWKNNAGYLTKSHLDAIDKYGLTEFHRPSFLKKHFAKNEQLALF